MVTGPIVTAGLNVLVSALTPSQRWEAAGRLDSDFMAEHWFILIAVVAIIILAVLLLVVSLHRMTQRRKATNRLFVEYAEKRGLSGSECQILLDIAGNAGLKRNESIFTLVSAFDSGTAKMIEESIARQGAEASNQLRTELSFLREKLGFQKQSSASIGSTAKLKRLSSRQIPVGKKIYITRRTTRISNDIEATITKNNDMELTVKLTIPVKITFGESWRMRYYFGASAWEFDSSVISSDGDILVLRHNDNVRFINRRRFLRVPVSKPASIAHFPFVRALPPDSDSGKEDFGVGQTSADGNWGQPEFVPAVVTELAGPGLRIETVLEVKVGDRVLVMFRLDEETATSKIIEDIGEVRHTKAVQNGLSIAVELTGLSDSDVTELIRATNAASLTASTEGQNVPEPAAKQRTPILQGEPQTQ